ncbi:MAG: signal peptide peptidase SppA [Humidesulfovibrio sp.]|uniref:signal peptide peptidase SppA n=1 Tax=Humidesulfovibrio sp. TaxID=2910988 RepID=UPI00273463A3|nr:signal peptide peptidase SppA [Humidesulfovibrio sp.]MDP2847073.1 signal peptide peptidase SppA [Humidesulfovibrio sp.]
MRPIRTALLPLLLLVSLALTGCAFNVNPFGSPGAPYKEQTLSGTGGGKILLISVDGLISERPRESMLRTRQSVVEEVAAQLKLARKDKDIKAVLLKVDSPGGTTTASDIVYHELMRYRQETQAKVVTVMMGLAASGGYYVALPSDHIIAHPTTVTGSVGVIFLQPRVAGLLDKIGVGVDVSKSGLHKDMGSPFRDSTPEEKKLAEAMVKAQAARFLDLVQQHRKLEPAALTIAASARVFTAQEARDLGLIDSVGYMEDAVAKAASLAGLPEDARVVTYRRRPAADSTWYQASAEAEDLRPALIHLSLDSLLPPQAGFYAVWAPALSQ